MRLNSKGFTLVEVLAVVVILGIISTIMISSVGSMIEKNKEDNYKNLEKSIRSAAKALMSDYRYDIGLDTNIECNNFDGKRDITSIKDITLNPHSRITLKMLVNNKLLSTNDGKILNPKNNKEINLDNSYIIVKYKCDIKDYIYEDIKLLY